MSRILPILDVNYGLNWNAALETGGCLVGDA
jgi:hypothetical protein